MSTPESVEDTDLRNRHRAGLDRIAEAGALVAGLSVERIATMVAATRDRLDAEARLTQSLRGDLVARDAEIAALRALVGSRDIPQHWGMWECVDRHEAIRQAWQFFEQYKTERAEVERLRAQRATPSQSGEDASLGPCHPAGSPEAHFQASPQWAGNELESTPAEPVRAQPRMCGRTLDRRGWMSDGTPVVCGKAPGHLPALWCPGMAAEHAPAIQGGEQP